MDAAKIDFDFRDTALEEGLLFARLHQYRETGRVYDLATVSHWAWDVLAALPSAMFRHRYQHSLEWPDGCRLALQSSFGPLFLMSNDFRGDGVAPNCRLEATNRDAPPLLGRLSS